MEPSRRARTSGVAEGDRGRAGDRRISRRDALSALGVALCPALGCVASVQELQGVDFRRLDPGRVLLVGRVQVRHYDDLTRFTAIETNESALGGYQLDPSGTVAWLVKRPRGDLRVAWLTSHHVSMRPALRDIGMIHLGDRGPLLMPRGADAPVIHFGGIRFRIGKEILSPFEQDAKDAVGYEQTHVRFEQEDAAGDVFAGLLARNPTLEGLSYLHLPTGQHRRVQARAVW